MPISFLIALSGAPALAQESETHDFTTPADGEPTPTVLGPREGDPRTCFPIVTGQRRFRCGDSSGQVWGILGTSPSLRKVLGSHPDSKKQLALADGLRVTGTALNATTAIVSGVVLFRVIESAVSGRPQVSISVGEVIVLLGGSLAGSAVNSAAKNQLQNAIDAYNLADARPLDLGLEPGAVVASDGRLVPTIGARLRF